MGTLSVNVRDRFGISTIVLGDQTVLEAIEAVYDAGFRWIELFSAPPQHSLIGWPKRHMPTLWPRGLSTAARSELRDALRYFDDCIVHVQLADVRMDHPNPGLREESRRQYFEYLELGCDLGASRVTLHHAGDPVGFGREFADAAQAHGILSGYETGDLRLLWSIIEEIDRPNFGLLCDLAHSYMFTRIPAADGSFHDPAQELRRFQDKVFEVHVHGLWREKGYERDHQNWDRNNVIDVPAMIASLKHIHYDGPFIFEISEKDTPTVVESCLEFREAFAKLWEQT